LSFITPPVAPTVYVLAPLAKSDILQTALQAVRLGIVAYIVPFIFIFKPTLLMLGTPNRGCVGVFDRRRRSDLTLLCHGGLPLPESQPVDADIILWSRSKLNDSKLAE
jgi:hypothetical protein